jgi:plasmid stabilization system protein ParE
VNAVAILRQEFLDELDGAAAWMAEKAGAATALRFLDAVDATVGRIEEDRQTFRFDERIGARRVHIEGFRYLIWFEPAGGEVRILALTHGRLSDSAVSRMVAHGSP